MQTLALAAVIALIALAIDDLIHFMNGDDSVIGEIFEKLGIDADAARQTIGDVISFLGNLIGMIGSLLGGKVFEGIGKFFIWSTEKVKAAGEWVGKTIGDIIDWFNGLKETASEVIDMIAVFLLGTDHGGGINLVGDIASGIGDGIGSLVGLDYR